MKRTITLRFLLSLCVLTLCSFLDRGGNIACAEEVTYEKIVRDFPINPVDGSWLMESMDQPQTYTSGNGLFNITFSWGGATLTERRPSVSNTDYFELRKNQEVTVSMADGTSLIKKIVFIFNKNSLDYCDTGSYANGTWEATDPTTSVTFKRKGGYVRVTGMTITYEPASVATKKDVTMKMSDAATIDLLETYQASAEVFTTDDDTKVEGAAISYSIEPASGDFSFDEETGLFTAGKTEGTYTITASFKGDDDHNMADASTTVTVSSRVWALKNYVQVTDESQVIDGAQYLLVYDDGEDLNVMSTYNNYEANNAPLTYADYKDGNLMRVSAEYAGAPFVLEAVGDNKYALKTSQGYLECYYDSYNGTTSYGLMISETSDIEAAQWTITIADGKAHIVNVYDPALELCYVSDYGSNSFKARSYTGNALTLYAKCADMNFNKLANGYATYAIGSAYQMPAGVKGYVVKGLNDSNEKLVKEEAFSAGGLVPALTPLLVYAENLEGEDKTYYPILLQKEVEDYTDDNYLEYKRTAEKKTASKQSEPVYYYKLTMKADSETPENNKPLGFYWGAENGAAFMLNNTSSAYLALPQSLFANGSLASALFLDEAGQATDIQLTTTTENNTQAVYNLQGVRVSGKLAKGIYIVNGKKVLVK